jgi:hypothetical protein
MSCQDSAHCDMSCSGGSCQMTCSGDADCNMSCSGGSCDFTCATTGTCCSRHRLSKSSGRNHRSSSCRSGRCPGTT